MYVILILYGTVLGSSVAAAADSSAVSKLSFTAFVTEAFSGHHEADTIS